MLAIVVLILQIVLGLVSLVIGIIHIPLWAILLIALVLIDIFNGAPATTQDTLQAAGQIIQIVVVGIQNIKL
jgi:uncharacterized SAM-binding protein YcdF (DUF218 family)